MTRVLVVEDNDNLRRGLRELLELDGFEVTEADGGASALASLHAHPHDLIILDLMLPDFAGERVLREVRRIDSGIPVMVLTAKHLEDDKVRAFQLGADDYVTKPFGKKELSARIDALLRRRSSSSSKARANEDVVEFGDVRIDVPAQLVTRAGRTLHLAPREFELLMALVLREGRVVSRDELLKEVWGYTPEVRSRTVDLHILELRRQLERDPSRPEYFLTVRKFGYRFTRGPADAVPD